MLHCVDTGFIPDCTLDELPLPVRAGAARTGGTGLSKPRLRAALAAAAALAPAHGRFTRRGRPRTRPDRVLAYKAHGSRANRARLRRVGTVSAASSPRKPTQVHIAAISEWLRPSLLEHALVEGAFATDFRRASVFDYTRKKPPGGAKLPLF